ncbi:MAG: hypothetical protein HYV60_24425 [Planctomycetia bacterium]|nr:hypothetical protein [Planctomycetia bacterium]
MRFRIRIARRHPPTAAGDIIIIGTITTDVVVDRFTITFTLGRLMITLGEARLLHQAFLRWQ